MNPEPLGYHNGMRQPSILLNFVLPYSDKPNNAKIAEFLETGFEVEVVPCKFGKAKGVSEEYRRFLSILSALSKEILQGAKVPVFDDFYFQLVTLDQKGEKSNITIRAPFVDNLPLPLLKAAINSAYSSLKVILQTKNNDTTRAKVYDDIIDSFVEKSKKTVLAGDSTIPALRAAYRNNIPFSHIGGGIYKMGLGSAAVTIDRSITHNDTAVSARITGQKVYISRILKSAGFPTPQHIQVQNADGLKAAADKIGFPVVVKPSDKERGEGITTNISSLPDLKSAYDKARAISNKILVEKHIPGVCHRVTIVDGEIVHVVRRDPRKVTGDGKSTIAKLIQSVNDKECLKPKFKRRPLLPLDDLTRKTLAENGYTPEHVLPEGDEVPVRDIENTEFGGEPVVFTDSIHPHNVELAKRASDMLHMATSGVDIISKDITVPWYENGAVINEMNFSPTWGDRLEYMRAGRQKFLNRAFPTKGRIPVHVYIGDAASTKPARSYHQAQVACGTRSYLVFDDTTLGPEGELPLAIERPSVFLRTRSLCLRREVEEMVLVLDSIEFLETGLPVDRINSVTVMNHNLESHKVPGTSATQGEVSALLNTLQESVLGVEEI